MNAAGTDYDCHGRPEEEEFVQGWRELQAVLAEAPARQTRQEILRDWPSHLVRPSEATLWRWLERAVAQGWVRQTGTGRKGDALRYWLPGQEQRWLDKNPD